MTIENFLKKAETLDMGKIITEALKKHEGELLAINQRLQLWALGVDSAGKKLKGYSKGYQRTRARKGLPTSPTSLYFTGRFYKAQKIDYKEDEIIMGWPPVELGRGVSLRDILERRYGKAIAGVFDLRKVQELILPDIQKSVLKYLS